MSLAGVEGKVTINWDAWRAQYDDLTFEDQQTFYAMVAQAFPEQQSFDLAEANDAFDTIAGDHLEVTELGGWDGRLASALLLRGDIASWVNYDLVRVPQKCSHPGYRQKVLRDFIWNTGPVKADVFVACHTIEHLSAADLELLFRVLDVQWIHLQAPLEDEATDWTGYPGSHILEVGWHSVDAMLEVRGYCRAGERLWVKE